MSDAILLEAAEARILGCLIEKEATTPELYPLTLNAIQSAANQKTSREPLMQLGIPDIGHALRQLEDLKLVRVVAGARVQRYAHRADEQLKLTGPQTALLAVTMLRGPQTIAELHQRVQSLSPIADAQTVRAVLDRLATREPALVVCVGRRAGQREDRYSHLLCGTPPMLDSAPELPVARESNGVDLILARLDELEARIAELERDRSVGQ